jgi:hypothetical protein
MGRAPKEVEVDKVCTVEMRVESVNQRIGSASVLLLQPSPTLRPMVFCKSRGD